MACCVSQIYLAKNTPRFVKSHLPDTAVTEHTYPARIKAWYNKQRFDPYRISVQTSSDKAEITMSTTSYQSIITLEPGKRSGKPTIRGLRITVYDVLSYLAAGMTPA